MKIRKDGKWEDVEIKSFLEEHAPKPYTPSHDAYWLRTMATAAMQGMLSDMKETDTYINPDDDGKQPLCNYVAECAVQFATALLEEIKRKEAENETANN
jgi:hypothetical protein